MMGCCARTAAPLADKSPMPNPLGINGHTKPFATALRMQIKAGGEPKVLRAVAQKLIECALEGESWAMTMLIDRLDGKVAQVAAGGGEPSPAKFVIEWRADGDAAGPDAQS